jgi:squalene-hopene/tetraprenyl-beta-curcumene cyclase
MSVAPHSPAQSSTAVGNSRSAASSEPTPLASASDVGPAPCGRVEWERAWHTARRQLLEQRRGLDHWTGELSTSALSTATAVSALSVVRKSGAAGGEAAAIDAAIDKGRSWLLAAQNADGGFGDTDLSHSNIATTYLALAAWYLSDFQSQAAEAMRRAEAYCQRLGGWDALRRRYGTDKTFVVPILTNCALAGLAAWDQVTALPFEAAWLPQSWYRLARMPVVSYAVPALVAIGQAKFYHQPPRNPLLRRLRQAAVAPTLKVLGRMQPASGGYLEAVPLTSFVLMSLASTGRAEHSVARQAVRFLLDSRLADGSWPIDTNLATWTTSLSIHALAYAHDASGSGWADPVSSPVDPVSSPVDPVSSPVDPVSSPVDPVSSPVDPVSDKTVRWLLSCQHLAPHPFTGADPGGWGWTNLSGAVPDADDTPAALLALAGWLRRHRGRRPMLEQQIGRAAALGLGWLVRLQNRDGGWPTFCRGWGKLPFDRSGADLTAHALRAISVWREWDDVLGVESACPAPAVLERSVERGFRYLSRHQNADGAWVPLWFGNQDRPLEDNPVYGTARVLLAYAQCGRGGGEQAAGVAYLRQAQNPDGGWGGGPSVPYRTAASQQQIGSSVEETGAAVEALLACSSQPADDPTIMRGLRWLVAAVEQGRLHTSWPIGFYFAKLWYHERLYPYIAATAALGAAVERLGNADWAGPAGRSQADS